MSTTIDSAGRLVVPKAVRDAAGLQPGMPLEVRYRDGRIEIEPAPMEIEIVEEGGVAVARARRRVPPLTAQIVDAVQDGLRDDRG